MERGNLSDSTAKSICKHNCAIIRDGDDFVLANSASGIGLVVHNCSSGSRLHLGEVGEGDTFRYQENGSILHVACNSVIGFPGGIGAVQWRKHPKVDFGSQETDFISGSVSREKIHDCK